MTGQYLHPVEGWQPIATVSGGGGTIDVSDLGGHSDIPATSPITDSLDDNLWDALNIEWAAAPINGAGLFRGLAGITEIPFAIPAVSGAVGMFYGCSSLTAVPLFDTSSVTNMSNMFQNCSSLTAVPLFDTSSVTNMTAMFSGCSSLDEVPAISMAAVTSPTNAFGQAGTTTAAKATQLQSCTRFRAYGATRGFTINGTLMDATALNELMTNLGTAAGTQTLNIRYNPGSATCDPSIATAKGWTVLT